MEQQRSEVAALKAFKSGNYNLECPFCRSTGWTDETDRLAHVLDHHSAALFMCSAILDEFRRLGVSWDGYRDWLTAMREQYSKLGR